MNRSFIICIILLVGFRLFSYAESSYEVEHPGEKLLYSAREVLNANPDSAQILVDSCYIVLSKRPNTEILAKCNYLQSELFYRYQQYEDAMKLANTNIPYYKKNNQPENLARTLYLTGLCKYNRGDFRVSIIDLISSCAIFDSLGLEADRVYSENVIGSCFFELEEYELAGKYYRNVYRFAEKGNDSILLLLSLNNMALIFDSHQKSIDSSIIYLKKALKLAEELNTKNAIVDIHINLADSYIKLGAYKTAREHLSLAENLLLDSKKNSSLILIQLNYALIYMKTGDYKSAIFYADKGLRLSEKYNYPLYLNTLYLEKAEAYKKINNYPAAFEQMQNAYNYRDSLWNEQIVKTASESHAKYNSKKNIEEIKLKQVLIENQQERLKQQKIKNIILSVALGVILLFVFITIKYSQKLKTINHSLKQKNQIINEKNHTLKETISTRDRLISIIAHDIKNPLGTIAGFSELITTLPDDELTVKSRKFAHQILKSSRNLNGLLENLLEWATAQQKGLKLNPETLSVSGLIQNNFNLMSEMAKQKNIQLLNYCLPEHFVFSDNNTTQTIVRNIITNAIKFTAEGGEIKAWSRLEENNIFICVEDNGIGISESDLPKLLDKNADKDQIGNNENKGLGMGLVLCKDFAQLNNGKISVKSELGKGSCFTIQLPCVKN